MTTLEATLVAELDRYSADGKAMIARHHDEHRSMLLRQRAEVEAFVREVNATAAVAKG